MDDDSKPQELLALTTEIVASFVGNNAVAMSDLPALIASVFQALRATGQAEPEKPAETPTPAVPIKKSVQQDFIVCLEDGKKLKMLKRHLATPLQHDARRTIGAAGAWPRTTRWWRRPTPTQRSALAKQIGLGRKPAAPVASEPPAAKAAAATPRRGPQEVCLSEAPGSAVVPDLTDGPRFFGLGSRSGSISSCRWSGTARDSFGQHRPGDARGPRTQPAARRASWGRWRQAVPNRSPLWRSLVAGKNIGTAHPARKRDPAPAVSRRAFMRRDCRPASRSVVLSTISWFRHVVNH